MDSPPETLPPKDHDAHDALPGPKITKTLDVTDRLERIEAWLSRHDALNDAFIKQVDGGLVHRSAGTPHSEHEWSGHYYHLTHDKHDRTPRQYRRDKPHHKLSHHRLPHHHTEEADESPHPVFAKDTPPADGCFYAGIGSFSDFFGLQSRPDETREEDDPEFQAYSSHGAEMVS